MSHIDTETILDSPVSPSGFLERGGLWISLAISFLMALFEAGQASVLIISEPIILIFGLCPI